MGYSYLPPRPAPPLYQGGGGHLPPIFRNGYNPQPPPPDALAMLKQQLAHINMQQMMARLQKHLDFHQKPPPMQMTDPRGMIGGHPPMVDPGGMIGGQPPLTPYGAPPYGSPQIPPQPAPVWRDRVFPQVDPLIAYGRGTPGRM